MINKNLDKIDNFIISNKVSSIEKKRLGDDLETVYERLSKGEYIYMDYSLKNKFNVPERTQEFFLYLESYCLTGITWSKIINKLNITQYSEVVDLCSGWAPKITLALFYSDFKGKMVLFDKNKKSMNILKKFMKLFNPKYKFENVESDIMNYSGKKFPFIIANHVIDDLILDMYCNNYNISTKTIYEKEETVKNLWDEIVNNTEFYNKTLSLLVSRFDYLIDKNGIICFAQYQSMMEGLLSLNNSVQLSKKMMFEIVNKLEKCGYKILTSIPEQSIGKFKGAFLPEECLILKKSN